MGRALYKGIDPGCDVVTSDKRVGMVRTIYKDTGRVMVQFGLSGPFEEWAPGKLTVVKGYDFELAKTCPHCGKDIKRKPMRILKKPRTLKRLRKNG